MFEKFPADAAVLVIGPDGNLDLTVYDVATNAIQDSWSVGPNK